MIMQEQAKEAAKSTATKVLVNEIFLDNWVVTMDYFSITVTLRINCAGSDWRPAKYDNK